jgi:hypothetical protein
VGGKREIDSNVGKGKNKGRKKERKKERQKGDKKTARIRKKKDREDMEEWRVFGKKDKGGHRKKRHRVRDREEDLGAIESRKGWGREADRNLGS